MYKWSKDSKHKKSIISAPGLARMVLRPFLTCMYLAQFSIFDRNMIGIFGKVRNFRKYVLVWSDFRKKRNFRYNFGQGFRTRVSVTVSVIFAKIFGLRNPCFSSVKIRNFRCRKFRLSLTPKLRNFFSFALP